MRKGSPLPEDRTATVPDAKASRKTRLRRLGMIFAIALASGHLAQTANQVGQASAAVAMVPHAHPPTRPALARAAFALVAAPHMTAGLGVSAEPALIRISATAESAPSLPQPPADRAPDCPARLDLSVEPDAMLGLSLIAPCHADEPVQLDHAGLTVTQKTNAAGSLFLDLPALAADGAVTATLADGTTLHAAMAVPEIAGRRRLVLAWQAGADFALTGADLTRMTPLGDAGLPGARLAVVYTMPADAPLSAQPAVEAAVRPDTCGHPMQARTLASLDGRVTETALTLSMPGCDVPTGYLVLKNLFGDMKIAAAD